jgi:hypothetical protein
MAEDFWVFESVHGGVDGETLDIKPAGEPLWDSRVIHGVNELSLMPGRIVMAG